MAVGVGHITSGNKDDKSQVSCLGFAGQGSGSATMIQVDFDWTLDAGNMSNLKLTITNLRFQCSQGGGLLNSDYQWYLAVLHDHMEMPNSVPSEAVASAGFSYDFGGNGSSRVPLDYSPGQTLTWYLGDVNNWTISEEGNLQVWIGGCSTYSVQDPVYPWSVPITFVSDPPLFPQDYYPWMRRISGSWYSCNRDGSGDIDSGSGEGGIVIPGGSSNKGALLRRENGSWADVKNEKSGSKADGRRYNNGWQKSPKTGLGA